MSISLAPHACQIPQKTAGAAGLRQRVEKPWKIFLMIATLPWPCLQAAIEQILQESDEVLQEKQLQEWQRLKTLELRDVSFVVSLSTFEASPSQNYKDMFLIVTGHAHCICRRRIHTMGRPRESTLVCMGLLVRNIGTQPRVRHVSLLPRPAIVKLRNQPLWQQAAPQSASHVEKHNASAMGQLVCAAGPNHASELCSHGIHHRPCALDFLAAVE